MKRLWFKLILFLIACNKPDPLDHTYYLITF